ncbi:MAG TPA: ATP-binding protein [Verrucomicrobiae bacterium]|nr:ATP-binding protein [Verrucomicrobiae bacterium]
MWPALFLLSLVALFVLHRRWSRERLGLERELRLQKEANAGLAEQQRTAQAQSQIEQEALFNSMVEGVLLLDAQGRVRLVNRALLGLFEVDRDVHGKSVIEAFRSHELRDIVQRAREEKRVLNTEIELPGPGNRCLQINAAALPHPEAAPGPVLVVIHDLTRLKQLENTRKEFVANVSHELRTPLSLIKGYVETLINGAKDDPAVAEKFLHTIEKHADRLTFLIEDLLTISRLESGQIILNLQPVELQPLAQQVLNDLQARAAEKQTRLENQVSGGWMVKGDTDRLEQVLFNIVDNAIKYGRPGGLVTVGATARNGEKVEVWVRDDGPGIPPESLDRVFERFYRVDRARSREQGGTGLGLAIVKHIVQSHNGEVWVTSELGQGATFHFTLPREADDK